MIFHLVLLVSSCFADQYIVPPVLLKEASYPEWAHYHWVWLSNDRANQSSMIEYAKQYLDHDIQVGAVDIDSSWSTGFNNFIFDTKKYPNAAEMIDFFHSKNIRVIIWATSFINTDSSNYKEAHKNGYLLRNTLDIQATISWWHGKGGLLDYSNPEAVDWWHTQMDQVLSLGIDGWKCDGTDPYVYELVIARGKGGVVTRKAYSDAYYGDFFDYTRKKLGKDRLIMSRPVDGYDFIFLDYSPQRVVLSGWVGDEDPTFQGMENALKRYLQSAWAGYPNFGSDIGGYRSGDGTIGRTKELFIRWAQLGAFSPLMENGGNKEHKPWAFDNETLEIYKKFVDIHYQLVPYLLSVGSRAIDKKTSSITPLAKHDNFIEKLIDDFKPSTYNYLLGDAILVAPIYKTPQQVSVEFPLHNGSSSWVYWFDHTQIYHARDNLTYFKCSLDHYIVFHATDSIIPLRVTKNSPVYGQYPSLVGHIRWWLFLTNNGRSKSQPVSFEMREYDSHGISATWRWPSFDCLEVNISAHQSIQSLIEIETHSLSLSINSVQELKTDGTFYTMPQFLSHTEAVANEGGLVMRKDKGLVSIVIHPIGSNKFGHSFVCCLK